MEVSKHVVESQNYKRTVWFIPGPKDIGHPLCVFLDGEFYVERMGTVDRFEKLIASNLIPHMSLLFVSHESNLARHKDYTCNDEFADFVAKDLTSWAQEQLSSIQIKQNIICGVSISGLASAHIALKYPKIFSSSLCQSGSFWWNRKYFSSLVSKFEGPIKPKFWLSVGDKEVDEDVRHEPTDMHQEFSQLVGVQSAVDSLRAGGAEVHHHVYSGGHEFGPWTAELSKALPWLLADKCKESSIFPN